MAFEVHKLDKLTARELVLAHHYSGRCPGIRCAHGLYEAGTLVGCAVYAVPASYTLCSGVCGPAYRAHVIELARLVILTTTHNAASSLVGGSLAALDDHVVVSYADCNDLVGHVGYVYQSSNWLYTGQGSAEPAWVDEATGEVVSYTRRHIDAKARAAGYAWAPGASSGPGLVRRRQVGKHRYVYLTGSRRFRRDARAALRYPVLPYPKGATRRHSGNIMQVAELRRPADLDGAPRLDGPPPPRKKLGEK